MRSRKKVLTPEEQIFKTISDQFSIADVNKWKRRHENIKELITQVQKIEKKIMDLKSRAEPLYDKISILRQEMVDICVHESQYLVLHDNNIVECKFCNKKMNIINQE